MDNKFIGGASADVLKGYSGDNSTLICLLAEKEQISCLVTAVPTSSVVGTEMMNSEPVMVAISSRVGMVVTRCMGFGLNTFEDEADGAVDSLYFKSDQWEENWIYGKLEIVLTVRKETRSWS